MVEPTMTFVRRPVWTRANTTTPVFHPLTQTLPSQFVHDVAASFDLRQSSGNIEVRAGIQYSDDPGPGGSWDAAKSLTVANVVPITKSIEGSLVEKAKVHLEFWSSSQDIKVLPMFQYTNSAGTEWSDWTALELATPSYIDADSDGWTYATTFDIIDDQDTPTANKVNRVRFGCKALNQANTTVDCVMVRMIVDITYTG